ncbi:hypothetical protein M0811_06186 [Anaeramoeba ignava]|uniref:Uncharacterized protein n=1 Tax=Anaeramoeba ignava TaxID=1746090 RepID=A0A9Q0LPY6_ANAIG|nr:hypothetical protein M0811_06186 [Anaeramoeba ignava]
MKNQNLDFFETNFFEFNPNIQIEENSYILENFKILKSDAIHIECDFRSNILDFFNFVIEEENIIEQIANNKNFLYIEDVILWISYAFKPKLKENKNTNYIQNDKGEYSNSNSLTKSLNQKKILNNSKLKKIKSDANPKSISNSKPKINFR